MENDPQQKPCSLKTRQVFIVALLTTIIALIVTPLLTPARLPYGSLTGLNTHWRITPRKAREIISQEGKLLFFHEGSIYTFHNDHKFSLKPNDMGGGTIDGTWTEKADGVYEIDGKWGFINGVSAIDDYRTMSLTIVIIDGQGTTVRAQPPRSGSGLKVYTGEMLVGPSVKKEKPNPKKNSRR